jgi:hypothetical protein
MHGMVKNALIAGLVLAASNLTLASPPRNSGTQPKMLPSHPGSHGPSGNHPRTHRQPEHGVIYEGRHHHHWKSQVFSARYGCILYFDPACECHYYWCAPDGCFYPVTHCPHGRYHW